MGSNDHMGYFTWYVCICVYVCVFLYLLLSTKLLSEGSDLVLRLV